MFVSVLHAIERLRPFRLAPFRRALGAHYKFPLYSLPSSLIDNLAAAIPIPLIVHFYGTESAGLFALVQRMLSAPLVLVCGSVAEAFHGRMAAHLRESPGRMRGFFLKTTGTLFLAGIVPALALSLAGERLFGLVFGAKWAAAGALLPAVAPWAVAQLAVNPVSRIIFVLDGQQLKLLYDFLSLGGVLLAVSMGATRGLSFTGTVWLLSASQVVAYGVYFLVLLWLIGARRAPAERAA